METQKFYPILLQWMRHQKIDDKMRWKNDAIEQECFIRDVICQNALHVPVFVVSVHTSKSIVLPVYRFRMKNGIVVTARDNFHGWVVSINCPFEVTLPEDLIWPGELTKLDCEGFHADWVYPYGRENVRLSTFRVSGKYEFWGLMRHLNLYQKIEKERHKLNESIICSLVESKMNWFAPELDIYDVFPTYSSVAYNCDFCNEHELKCFFSPNNKDASPEEILTEKIKDFAKRMSLTEESSEAFIDNNECLNIGKIQEPFDFRKFLENKKLLKNG